MQLSTLPPSIQQSCPITHAMCCVSETPPPAHLVQDALCIALQELKELPPLRHLHSNTDTHT